MAHSERVREVEVFGLVLVSVIRGAMLWLKWGTKSPAHVFLIHSDPTASVALLPYVGRFIQLLWRGFHELTQTL